MERFEWLFNTTDGENDYSVCRDESGNIFRVYEDGTEAEATEIDYEVLEMLTDDLAEARINEKHLQEDEEERN